MHSQLGGKSGDSVLILTQPEEVQKGILDRLYQPAAADQTSEDTAFPGTAAESPNSMTSRQVHRGEGLGDAKVPCSVLWAF